MTRPTVQEINITTGEEIVREMNDFEYEEYLADRAKAEEKFAAKEAQAE